MKAGAPFRIGGSVLLLAVTASPAVAGGIERELPVQIRLFGKLLLEFNHNTVLMCFVVAVLACGTAWICARSLREIPGRGQALLEMIFSMFDGLVRQSIGPKAWRKYLPWIGSLFLFLWFSNMIGILPVQASQIGGEAFHDYNHNGAYDPGEFDPSADGNRNGRHDPGFALPAFHEPTSDYNVPLALAILFVFLIGHVAHIRKHGLLGYIKSYFDPGGVIGVIMFPLNVVGKLTEVVSISFRLFGNIFGGMVILVIVSGLIRSLLLPIGMLSFFGVFVGTVQAFVFTILALTYISLGVQDEEAPKEKA
ncbi:MAG: F0F1 ATP synthase subunit A [Planctomycetota bacterium]